MDAPERYLVVKLTSGVEAPERLSQAFTVASTALASGVDVSLWLTGEATWMAVPGRAEEFELPYAAPLASLRDAVIAGGRITVCTQCAARRDPPLSAPERSHAAHAQRGRRRRRHPLPLTLGRPGRAHGPCPAGR